MVTHISLFKFTQKAKDEGEDAVFFKLEASAANMAGKIPGLLSSRLYRNLAKSPYDIIFIAEFENIEAIPPYLKSPLHTAHAEMAAPYVEGRVAADYEN